MAKKNEKTLAEHVAVAEKLAQKNTGTLPSAEMLKEHGFTKVSKEKK